MKFKNLISKPFLSISTVILLLIMFEVTIEAKQPHLVAQQLLRNKNDYAERVIATSLDKQFELKYAQVAFVRSHNLRIRFSGVSEDSRCPSEVACIWEGQVTIAVNVAQGSRNLGSGNLTISPRSKASSINFENYNIKLLSVSPYPKDSHKVELSEYSVTLVISRKKGEGASSKALITTEQLPAL
ncbi:MAG: hypothetical protein ACAF41_33250 (plasmid) [Leptolyngbya sp. BL-A-14]